MIRRATALTLTALFAGTISVAAAEPSAKGTSATPISDAVASAAKDAAGPVTLWTLSQQPKRPMALPVLYGTYAVLQGLDVMSTKKAIAAGATEANPAMRGGNMGTTVAIKAAAGAATIFLAEKTWKKNRVGAVVLMAVLNGASAAVVAHNNRNARR